MELKDLNKKYRTYVRRPLRPELSSCIIYPHVYNKNKEVFEKLLKYFDENNDYRIEIIITTSDNDKFKLYNFRDFLVEISRWQEKSFRMPNIPRFRYGSYQVIIEEREGKDLFVIGELGVHPISHYDYYRNHKDDDILREILNITEELPEESY